MVGGLRIKLVRWGFNLRPFYVLSVMQRRQARNSGSRKEDIGWWDPNPAADGNMHLGLKMDRLKYWLTIGAKPTDKVADLLGYVGVLPQLASWFVFFALASGVYAFYLPFVEDAGVRWFLVALYSVLVVAIVTLDLYTSCLDPSDPGLTGATDGEFFCGLCQASVARTSKHCRACDRFTEKDEMRDLVSDKYGKSVVYGGWQAALAIYMALLVISVVMLGELFFFHVVLISKGLTTYDYIIAQRDAKLAAPTKSSGANMKGCRSSRVADTTTAKRKPVKGNHPVSYDAASKVGKAGAAAAGGGTPGYPGDPAATDLTTSPPAVGKPLQLGALGSGSLGSNSSSDVGGRDGLGLSEKAAAVATGSVQELVARAVAEQTLFKQPSLREAAVLRGLLPLPSPSGAGGGGGGVPAGGPVFGGPGSCVPECGNIISEAGGDATTAGSRPVMGDEEFMSLELAKCQHQQQGGPNLAAGGMAAAACTFGTTHGSRHLGSFGSLPYRSGSLGGAAGAQGVASAAPAVAVLAPSAVVGLGNFDAAAAVPQPAGRHLGGHTVSPRGLAGPTAAAEPSAAAAAVSMALSRAGSLPPLLSAPSLPDLAAPGGGAGSRSLLFPSKSKSPRGTVGGLRGGELPTTPE
ncbi:hypothetical protein VOLCADRAFT_121256 [Volvox carteri f. nagariensis]|uniref:Uncharacterized protein n=1 Tax=Volvox carteri f. nagariensis TaxID=3068 RepID=D8U611_VOLCA|nr:uncharacterized protein VOLCADRAFT_121256 [Volvox carteri f. nagariensis]EFJ44857.1 hypothetical protein VOLCADRAFT_121256 [Volvox carteri f. nagariensis]|eukprot:XP_002954140.1 hypothetical protein VOLCADRAFT_121256 [Volvox carteri f. nagariensis]